MSMIVSRELPGYVVVRRQRDNKTICAAFCDSENRVKDVSFMDPADQKNNRTRQAAMKALQDAGYR